VAGRTVYMASNDQHLYALDAATGAVRWKHLIGSYADSSPAVANGTVYIGSWLREKVYALDAATGAVRWSQPVGSKVDSSPVVAGGTVYVGSDDHKVYAISAASGR
jgi:outer membrane protein assembly factor BamB